MTDIAAINPMVAVVKGGAEALLDTVPKIIDEFKITPDEKVAAKIKWQQVIQEHEKEMTEEALAMEELWQKDRDSARNMQIQAMSSKNWLTQNYIYILDTLMILGAFFFGTLLMYVVPPKENERFVEMFFYLFVFSGAISVVHFFNGSSDGSKAKTEWMGQKLNEVKDTQVKASDIDEVMKTRREKRRERKNDPARSN